MEETVVRSPDEAVQALRDCYCGNMLKLEQAGEVHSLREYLSGWLGGGRRRHDLEEALRAFHAEAEKLVETLCGALEDCPEQAARGAAAALEIILFYPPKQGKALDLSLAAMEGLSLPLIPHLERETAAGMVQRYRKRTPPRMMLPNQRTLFGRLKEQAELGRAT